MQQYSDTLAFDIRSNQTGDPSIFGPMDFEKNSDNYRFDNQQYIVWHSNWLYLKLKYKKRK
jgi:hypothetical protein